MFVGHRKRFLDLLRGLPAAAVIPTSSHKIRNHDSHYRYRPDSDFWYLTGFAEPDAVLVLVPRVGAGAESVLFLREKDRDAEIWNGRRLGVAAAPEALGVDEARPIDRLKDDLPLLLEGCERIVYRTGLDEARDRMMLETVAKLRARARGLVPPPVQMLDTAPFVHELRLRKSPEEIELIRRAAAITRVAHLAADAQGAAGRPRVRGRRDARGRVPAAREHGTRVHADRRRRPERDDPPLRRERRRPARRGPPARRRGRGVRVLRVGRHAHVPGRLPVHEGAARPVRGRPRGAARGDRGGAAWRRVHAPPTTSRSRSSARACSGTGSSRGTSTRS